MIIGLGTCTVQTQVSSDTFQEFLRAIQHGSELSLTPDNCSQLALLCEEFGADRLRQTCDHFAQTYASDSTLDFRLKDSALEFQEKVASTVSRVDHLANGLTALKEENNRFKAELRDLKDSVGDLRVKEEIERLKFQMLGVTESVSDIENLRNGLNQLKIGLEELRRAFKTWVPTSLGFPMKEAKSLEGIISYLTKKHGGNVHEKRIVTLSSKSVDVSYTLKEVTDLTFTNYFCSEGEPGQWFCWDFGHLRVSPTHYTMAAYAAKSWVVEGSLDGRNWLVLHRQTDNQDFGGWGTASFEMWTDENWRFIRLTQTDKRHDGNDYLVLQGVEFFGALSE